MAKTYDCIATTTVSGTPTEVVFSSITGTFTDLVLIASAQSNQTGSAVNALRIRFNDDTASNYSWTDISGDGTSVTSSRITNLTYLDGAIMTQTSSTERALNVINIMNYANATTYKTVLTRANVAGSYVIANVGLWRKSPEAITKITLYRDGTNTIKSGSTFTLYGIKAE